MQRNMLSHECWYLHIVTSQNFLQFDNFKYQLCNLFAICSAGIVGQDSVVVILISDHNGLNSPGIESQLGARFSTPVQTSPGAHTATYAMGIMSKGSKVAGACLVLRLKEE
jgi:hypothetical protein